MTAVSPPDTSIGRGFGRELAVVVLATVLAGVAAFVLSPPPEESASARAVLRAPADISSPSVVGLWIDSFELELLGPETTDAVLDAVPELDEQDWRDGVSVARQGFSVQFDASLDHPDRAVAAAGLSEGLNTTIERIGTVSLDRLEQDVDRARADLDDARDEQDALVAETGVFDARGTYQATLSDIRALERQVREATLLGFSSAYIAGLEAARAEAEAELPALVDLATRSGDIDSRIDESRNDLYAAEDRLAAAQVDYERLRSPEALLQRDVEVRAVTEVMPWAQRIVLAAGTAFVVALLLVVALQAVQRARRRRATVRWIEDSEAEETTIDLDAADRTAEREPVPASTDPA